ncbi:hypothetical protein NX059_002030 [Plenodomus lindquistii]|nr:hypothetical protein NX059_002030 [Plenodomus lindquistii]
MKNLKHKASRYFRDPSQDERAAIAETSDNDNDNGFDFDFNAGIQDHNVKKKASRFFPRKQDKVDKPLPAPPTDSFSDGIAGGQDPAFDTSNGNKIFEDDTAGVDKPLPFLPAPLDLLRKSRPTSDIENTEPLTTYPAAAVARSKSRPSLTALKTKSRSPRISARLCISVSPTDPSPPQRRSVFVPLPVIHGPRSSVITPSGRSVSISRPMLLPHGSQVSPVPKNPATVPFTKPTGNPPHRPPRPDSIDEETLAFMRESGTRMVLSANHRMSDSTASASTPRSGLSSINSRLGLPDGYGTPRKNTLDSPLAVQLPVNPFKPLPVRDSDGSVKYSRFSEYIKTQQDGYGDDGIDTEDREIGPIEQYDKNREGDWTVVKRISRGPGGQPGMLFRDRWNGFHFVADV